MQRCRLFFCVFVLICGLQSLLAGTVLRFYTSVGDFDVELYDQDKPVTVSNFLYYVNGGSYSNMIMHRVVQNFVIQGGGFNVAELGTTNAYVTNVVTADPITNEFAVGPFYSNVYGTIAMAKKSGVTNAADSATSQFFFNLANNSGPLDNTNQSGGFVVFGHVINGNNALNLFQIGFANRAVKRINLQGALAELPVLYSASPTDPSFDDLIYVDIKPKPVFTPQKAAYNGLVLSPDVVQSNPGQITLNTTAGQGFSGLLRFGKTSLSFSGAFDTNGFARVMASSTKSNLVVDLRAETNRVVGNVIGSNWIANLYFRQTLDPVTNPAAAFAGNYTVAFPGNDVVGVPAGHGFASVRVEAAGRVKIAGSFADGSKFSSATTVGQDGNWLLFAPLFGKRGFLAGWMAFTNRPTDDLHGKIRWRRPGKVSGVLFPGGFTTDINAFGSRYVPPASGTPVLGLTTWPIQFTEGHLTTPFTETVTLGTDNKLTNPIPDPMKLSVQTSTGFFKGSIKRPNTTRSIAFKGVLLQRQNSGYGYFLATDQSGRVLFGP